MDRPWSAVAIKRASPNSTDTDGGRRPIWALHHLESQVNEIKSLCHLREPSAAASRVVHLYEYYLASSREFYMVTELLGMELEEYKTSDLAVDFTEKTVRDMSRTILRALQYMHSKGKFVVFVRLLFSTDMCRSTLFLFSLPTICFFFLCVLPPFPLAKPRRGPSRSQDAKHFVRPERRLLIAQDCRFWSVQNSRSQR
jgi:serine/threonine protein kinase